MLIAVLLFIFLSPGLLLTIPRIGSKIFMSGRTSVVAVLVHAVIFAVLYTVLGGDMDGFQSGGGSGSSPVVTLRKGRQCSTSTDTPGNTHTSCTLCANGNHKCSKNKKGNMICVCT